MQTTLHEIAERIGAKLNGDGNIAVNTLCSIDDIFPASLVFAKGKHNLNKAESSDAVAILTDFSCERSSKSLLQVDNPFASFVQLISYFYPPRKTDGGIHPSAVIGENVSLGENVSIGPFVSIGNGAVIGDSTVLKSHVSVG